MYQATLYQNLYQYFAHSTVVVHAVGLIADLSGHHDLCTPKTIFSMLQLCFSTTGDASRVVLLLLNAWRCRSVFGDLSPILRMFLQAAIMHQFEDFATSP